MSKRAYIRIWQNLDLEEIQGHLLIAGDPKADCANCREIGIDVSNKFCPKCKTEFKYIATRIQGGHVQAKRLKAKRPDLIIIELSDFKEAQARDQAREFMK